MTKKIIFFIVLFLPAFGFAAGNVFFFDENVNLDKDYPADVYAFGNNVTLSGTIHGDLFAAASNLEITGTVEGDIRTAADNLKVKGKIGKNLQAAANNVLLEDLEVGKEVDLAANKITVEKNVKIGGALIYSSDQTATIHQNAQIVEGALWHKPEKKEEKSKYNLTFFLWKFIKLLGLLIVSLFPVYLFSNWTKKITANMEKPKSLLWGLLFVFVGPIIIFFVALTLVGLPLALIAFILYLITLYCSAIFAGLFLGQKIIKKGKLFWMLILGVTLFFILKNLPYIGFLIGLVTAVWVSGAILLTCKKNA